MNFIQIITKLGYLILFPLEWFYGFTKRINKKVILLQKKAFRKKAQEVKFSILELITKTRNSVFLTMKKYVSKSQFGMRKVKKQSKLKEVKVRKIKSKDKETKTNIIHSYNKRFKYFSLYVLGFISAIAFVFVPFQLHLWWKELPSPDLLLTNSYEKSTKITDRSGRLLYEIYIDKNYEPVKLEQIPQYVVDATIAVEDSQFYNHIGVRFESMIRAAYSTIKNDKLQGGSTITQQLIKNMLLTSERTVSRKVKEVILAVLVEKRYTKQQILELYLNNIPYGGESWGIQSASKKYFGKNVWELSEAEASMLAGLPSAPTVYSPTTDLKMAKERQRYVLDRMVSTGKLKVDQADEIFSEELVFKNEGYYIQAPHFVNLIRKDLEKRFGKRFVELGGLTVQTTLDLDLQDKVQKIVKDGIDASINLNITNGAAVVLDAKNAEILAYVGSIDYFKEGWGAYDVASAYRQPGSAIKAVTYALAFSKGYTPATTIEDSPITFQVKGSQPYKPVNYDSAFHGTVTLRSALANSYNIPAVKLANALGPDNIVALGKKMGLSNWEVNGNYGLSVTLGGLEVRLLDLANVFATFAREGMYTPVNMYLSVKDAKGYELDMGNASSDRVVSADVSYLIWSVLSDGVARLPAFGTRNFMTIPGHNVAVKTGTTDEKRDNWTFGFTPSYAVGVWVGNNNNEPMNKYLASGLSGAAPIWNSIFSTVLEEKPNEKMIMPEGVFVKTYSECDNKSEVFIKGSNIPKTICEVKKEDTDKKDNKD